MINPNRRWIVHVALAGGAVLCAVALGAAVLLMPEDKAAPTPAQETPDTPDTPGWVELPALAADTAPTGVGSGEETRITFDNQGDEAYVISWLEEDGTLTPYSTLAPGETYEQTSYSGHYWLVAKEDGTPVVMFQAANEPGHALIE
ncbi:VHL beta domain-containing protein [Catenuloplanes japonicus]|uniref:VHL beta domain-containing protein n=1 Tax=Catenuloplanes japonicus TaxID=33876 RepID=UPI000AE62417|nr:hypothetical protein [Catenuloplanes japonicus]